MTPGTEAWQVAVLVGAAVILLGALGVGIRQLALLWTARRQGAAVEGEETVTSFLTKAEAEQLYRTMSEESRAYLEGLLRELLEDFRGRVKSDVADIVTIRLLEHHIKTLETDRRGKRA